MTTTSVIYEKACHSRLSGILLKERFWTSQNDNRKNLYRYFWGNLFFAEIGIHGRKEVHQGYRELPKLAATLKQKDLDGKEAAAYNATRVLPTSTKGRDNIRQGAGGDGNK